MASTLMPFLYQTRTIQRAASRIPRNPNPQAKSSRTIHCCRCLCNQQRSSPEEDSGNIPFHWDKSDKRSPREGRKPRAKQDELHDLHGEEAPSTITPAEQRTFSDIFSKIARGRAGQATSADPYSSKPRDFEKAQSHILDIFRDAAGAGSRIGHSDPTRQYPENSSDTNMIPAWMMKYPPSLRQSARAAFDPLSGARRSEAPLQDQEQEKAEEETADVEAIERQVEQQRVREQAIRKMDTLLAQCKSDFEVWDVMEREVFSLPRRLGIVETVPQPDVVSDPEHPAPTQAGSPGLPMEIYGPLYAQQLFQCLRTLDQAFSSPSALTLRVLPRIRELGLASYVLGASTAFYNELCAIMWRRHGDVRGVLKLLQEMKYVGLSFDKTTLKLVHEMETALDLMGSHDASRPFSKVLATMPDYGVDVQGHLGKIANQVEASVHRG